MLDDKNKTESDNEEGGKNKKEKGYVPGTFDALKESLKDVKSKSDDVGATFSTIQQVVIGFNKNLGGSADSAALLGTNFTDAAQKLLLLDGNIKSLEAGIVSAAEKNLEIQEATNRMYIASSEELAGIVASQQASGVLSKTLITNFKDQGYALSQIPKTMEKVIQTSRALGVNVAAVSESVVTNISKLNTFNFSNGVEGLTRMAAQAGMIGVDMVKIFKIAEDLFDPEKAVELASSLQRLGVATGDLIDPLKLMDLGQNNPQELQNQIVEMSKRFTFFNEQNQKFEILPGAKRELREIASAMGMSADELAKMALGSSDLAKKMSEIRFPELGIELPEDQKTLIANMAEMKDGEYKIKFEETKEVDGERVKTGRVVEKSVAQLNPEDLESLKYQQTLQAKSLEDIALESMELERRTANAAEALVSTGRGTLATNRLANKGQELLSHTVKDLVNLTKEAATAKGGREFMDQGISDIKKLTTDVMSAMKDGKITDEEKNDLMKVGKGLDELMQKTMGKGGEVFEKLIKYGQDFPGEVGKALNAATIAIENTGEKTESEKTSSLDNPQDNRRLDAKIMDRNLDENKTQTQNITTSNVNNQTQNTQNVNNTTNKNDVTTNNNTSNTTQYDQVIYQMTQSLPEAFSNVKLPDVNIDLNPLTSLQEKQLTTNENSLTELKTMNSTMKSENETLISYMSRTSTPTQNPTASNTNITTNNNPTDNSTTNNNTSNTTQYDQVIYQMTQSLPEAFSNVKLPDVNIDLNPLTSLQEKQLTTNENSLTELKTMNSTMKSENETLISYMSRTSTPTQNPTDSNTNITTNNNPTDNSITNNSTVTNNDNKQFVTNDNKQTNTIQAPLALPEEPVVSSLQQLYNMPQILNDGMVTGLDKISAQNKEKDNLLIGKLTDITDNLGPVMPQETPSNPFYQPTIPNNTISPTVQTPEVAMATNTTTNNVTERIVESPMNNVGGTIEYRGELTLTVNVNAPDGMNKAQVEQSFKKMLQDNTIAQKIEQNVIGGRVGSYNPTVSVFEG
jgi:hypothetical protein